MVSPDVEEYVVPRGNTAYAEAAWRLKERIRRTDDALKQPRDHFERAYRRQRDYLLVSGDDVVAFGVIHHDGYLSLLGVSPDHRRQGLGSRLVGSMAEDYPTITCHTRVTNDAAVRFYEDLGFVVGRRIEGYYPDGTGALYLLFDSDDPASGE